MALITERLCIYPANDAEMERMIRYEKDPDLRQAYAQMLQGCTDDPKNRLWYAVWNIAFLRNPQIVIGNLSFKGPARNGAVEIGYGLHDGYQGHGYMTEAVRAICKWALSQDGVTKIEAQTDPQNTASQKVLLAAGFEQTGLFGQEGPLFAKDRSSVKKESAPISADEARQLHLNQRLYDVCTASPVDFAAAEDLLRQGALPMGKIIRAYKDTPNNLYDDLVEYYFEQSEILYAITALFLRYGMDLSKPAVPYGDFKYDCVLHPLAFFPDDTWGLRTMQLLLDHGLDADSAAAYWTRGITDLTLAGASAPDPEREADTPRASKMFFPFLRMLMLIASYPHVLRADKALQKEIWLRENRYDPQEFRNWSRFSFDVDTSLCRDPSKPEMARSVITIREKDTGKVVWTFGICLTPEEVFGRKEHP